MSKTIAPKTENAPQVISPDDPRLVPGNHPEGKSPADLRPCGQCDGVIFFLAKTIYEPKSGAEIIAKPSAEREALRYLRPMPEMWKAEHLGQIGISRPHGIGGILPLAEIEMAARAQGRGLGWLFTCDEHSICICQTRREQWRVVKAAEEVWCVLFCG